MNTKIFTDIINWAVTSGWLAAFLVFLWKLIKPLLDEKRKHAKTAQQQELLGLIESLADTAVTSLVGVHGVDGNAKFQQATKKFQQATQIVSDALASKGLSAPQQTIQAAVQSAYEKSPLTDTGTTPAGTAVAIDTKEGK